VVFCCRRGDREIQLTEAFTDPNFTGFRRDDLPGLEFMPMTLYHEKFAHLNVLFPAIKPDRVLGEIVSQAGLSQLRVAESEKYAHVTFFINGRRDEPYPGEDRVFIDSPPTSSLITNPGTSTAQVANEVVGAVFSSRHNLIVANLASGDMVGHLEDYGAKVRCAESVDASLGLIRDAAMAKGYGLVVTADHGLLETGVLKDGKPNVSHTTAPVPMIVSCEGVEALSSGHSLTDVAPTVLALMGLPIPEDMTGRPLVRPRRNGGKVVLAILDGWGIGVEDPSMNPIAAANTPVMDSMRNGPCYTQLIASGPEVGLPEGRYGNSEVGHMTIGAGRVVPGDEMRIARATRDGSLAKQENYVKALENMKRRGGNLHLIMILSERSSHGNIKEAMALARAASVNGVDRIYVHLILDGRSTPPQGGADLIPLLEKEGSQVGATVELVTAIGRAYALDRGGNYETKTQVAYRALVNGEGRAF
jgi:2,3-bisphosphoglycerate-independent phosphoglycerate mutase